MIVIMKPTFEEDQLQAVIDKVNKLGYQPHVSRGEKRALVGVVGHGRQPLDQEMFEVMPAVERVVRIMKPFKLASREFKAEPTVVKAGSVEFGGSGVTVIAGPCAIESEDQINTAARRVAESGARVLRGGAYKPRTSPYSFQGLQEEGLKYLRAASEETGLPTITEVMAIGYVEVVSQWADILQIGARNMQNFPLLEAVGRANKPVLLKRGLSSTIEEWLMSAEYILASGNPNVILCERGIRTFETQTRNTVDLAAVPVVKKLSHLPIIVDPSHATGKRHLIKPVAAAAIAAGADGLMVEVHPEPDKALCDGPQSLSPEQFDDMMTALRPIAAAVGRGL